MKLHRHILIGVAFALVGGLAGAANIHDFTGLPMTEDGWTDLLAMYRDSSRYTDSRIVYVSTSGDDGTARDYSPGDSTVGSDPFNPSETIRPYRTLDAGYRRLRSGYPDMLLLKRGDVWNESFFNWEKSGRSDSERMILGAYGPVSESRPIIERFRAEGTSFSHNIVVSIEMRGSAEDASAFQRRSGGQNFLMEDCAVLKNPNTGMVFGSGATNVAVRRCVVAERYPTDDTGHTQGLYAQDITNFLVEESIFDHNGWTDGAEGNGATIHNHNTYLHASVSGAIMRYNVSTRSSSKGFQPGGGGLIYANLSVRDGIGIESSRMEHGYSGSASELRSNVILDTHSYADSAEWAMRMNFVSESLVTDNIVGSQGSSTNRVGIMVEGTENFPVRNVTIDNNVFHNVGGPVVYLAGNTPELQNIDIRNNQIHSNSELANHNQSNSVEVFSSGNAFYSTNKGDQWFRYDGTWMSLGTWMLTVGDSSSEVAETEPTMAYQVVDYLSHIGANPIEASFYSTLQQQRKGNWDTRYTAVPIVNFVRDAFGREPVEYDYSLRYVEEPEPDVSPTADKPRGLRIEN